MQQIYRRTPTPKCDFNKVAKQFEIEISTLLKPYFGMNGLS